MSPCAATLTAGGTRRDGQYKTSRDPHEMLRLRRTPGRGGSSAHRSGMWAACPLGREVGRARRPPCGARGCGCLFHRAGEYRGAVAMCTIISAACCRSGPPAVAERFRLPPGTPPPCARNRRSRLGPSPHRTGRAAPARRRRFQPLRPFHAQRRWQPRTRGGPQLAADSRPSAVSHRSVCHRVPR